MKIVQHPTGSLSVGLSLLAAAALLAACGGGGADGGIGSGGTGQGAPGEGVAVGTVGGFGSIFVGGVRCDDTRAKVAYNTTAGSAETGTPEIRLGQRVQISYDATSATCKVLQALVDPELVGRVSSLSPLTVAGQRVVVATDAALAPPTVFEGYADETAIKVGDRVEVHGEPITVAGTAAVQATRIERKPVADTWVRAKGVVAGLSATQFTIGGLLVKRDGSTRLEPADLAVAIGQTVLVWSAGAPAADGSITARVVKLAARTLANQQAVRVEGPAAGCSTTPCTQPRIDGLAVDLSGVTTWTSGSAADVANGVAMRVQGSWDATRSVLVATQAGVRLRDDKAAEVNLIGLVADFVNPADFSVRGMQVTTGAGTAYGVGCSVSAAGQIVGVKGLVQRSQVLATRIDCLQVTDISNVDVFGAIVSVNTAERSFTISEGLYRGFTFSWDDETVFGGALAPAGMVPGLRFGLRAVVVDGKLVVRRVIADPLPASIPAGVQIFGNFGIAQDVTAGSLTVRKIQMSIVPATVINGTLEDGAPVRTWFYRSGPAAPWVALQINRVSWN